MPINYKKYPPNWKTEIVPAVLLRANDCCENCGLRNKSVVYSVKMRGYTRWFSNIEFVHGKATEAKFVLTVAHLDHDEHNNEVKLDRLKALCQLCHLRYDAEEKKRRKLSKSI